MPDAALDEATQILLECDLLALAEAYNTSDTGGLRIPSEYLEIVAVKAA